MPIGIPSLNKICKLDNCDNKHYSFGLCQKHSSRLRKYGDVNFVKSRKGIILSEEHKINISKSRKGLKLSQEVRKRLSVFWRNNPSRFYKRSEEIKEKLRSLRKGLVPWNKGIKRFDIRGEKNHNWKGGSGNLKRIIRNSFEYKAWRLSIFQRDNYTCVLCGKKGNTEINVDHYPKMFSELIHENNIESIDGAIKCDALWDIKNNRTLCVSCHKKTPTYMNGAFINK